MRDVSSFLEIRKSGLTSDIVVSVDGTAFDLHKALLASRTGHFRQLAQKGELSSSAKLDGFPGGSTIFSTIVDFVYGIDIELNFGNITSIYCGAFLLGMDSTLSPIGSLLDACNEFVETRVDTIDSAIEILSRCKDEDLSENSGLVAKLIRFLGRDGATWTPNDKFCSLPLKWYQGILNLVEAGGASVETVTRGVQLYLNWSRQNLKTLDSSELSELVGQRDLQMPGEELVELFLLASRTEAGCTSHLAKLTAQSMQDVCESTLALDLNEKEIATVVRQCSADEERTDTKHGAALVDRWLTSQAEKGTLTVDVFVGLAQLSPPDARRYHDGLWPSLRYILQTSNMEKEEKRRVCSAVDFSRLTPETMRSVLSDPSLVPSRNLVTALMKLCADTSELVKVVDQERLDCDNLMQQLDQTQIALNHERSKNEALRRDLDTLRAQVPPGLRQSFPPSASNGGAPGVAASGVTSAQSGPKQPNLQPPPVQPFATRRSKSPGPVPPISRRSSGQ